LNRNHFDIGGNVVFAAKVEHFLGLSELGGMRREIVVDASGDVSLAAE
jgi:hypothetical protein